MKKIIFALFAAFAFASFLNAQSVNPTLFLEDGVNVIVSTVTCTLSDGTSTTCYQIVTKATPTDHTQGPWCPTNISDDASAGGIWLENGQVYDVDGAFIQNLATFYNDNTWQMYNTTTGEITRTLTQADCQAAANPNVGVQYQNYCVECLPSYVSNLSSTYLIPVNPVYQTTTVSFGMGPGATGPSARGLAFNGVRFDAPAPVNAILGAYTLAPFDDAGGHINLAAGYHYHAATGVTTEIEQCDVHAPQIGYALDGHGIYAHLDPDGNEATGLDACRGHSDSIRGYHYHVDAAGSNNFIDCLHGAYASTSSTTVVVDSDQDGYNLDEDCDDTDASVNPNATEIDGNYIDENCDGIICAPSSTNQLKLAENNFTVFPNPATNHIELQFSSQVNEKLNVKLIDLSGKIMLESSIDATISTIDVSEIGSGVYFLQVVSKNMYYPTQKIVITK